MAKSKKKTNAPVVYDAKYINALESLTDEKLQEYIDDYNADTETFTFSVVINQDPDQYVMSRYSSKMKKFYNPKESVEIDYKRELLNKISKEDYNKIYDIIHGDKIYTVEVFLKFYIQTQKNLNIKQFILAEKGIRRPTSRRDCDNMAKLFLDAMAGVLYTDDCYVVPLHVDKFNSINPRIEATYIYTVHNEIDRSSKKKKLKGNK